MTHICLEQVGKQYTVKCQGHATGSVEACAAVSCLVYTLAGWLRNTSVVKLDEKLEAGDALIRFCGGDAAETAFDMITVGFLQLQEQYGEYISVDFRVI
ncbi:MAG: ribosomal-processing cysteine protease Prp [Oscillospiraceae bacterium]|nr:ribosomal-processing cysteine protease Prp [Oscillospiraceae bacterium]